MSNLDGIFGDKGQEATAEAYSSGSSVLAPGKYKVVITEAEIKDTKAGTGKYIAFKFETQNGDSVMEFCNIKNPNEVATRIGREALAKISTCSGITNLTDTSQLIGQQVVIKVEQFEEEYNGNMIKKNKIKGYFPKTEKTGVAPVEEKSKTDAPW